jgi:hypothetical protein
VRSGPQLLLLLLLLFQGWLLLRLMLMQRVMVRRELQLPYY